MKIFDVYPIFDIEPVKGQGSYIWDKKGEKYLDLYGGHAVISIGHSHPTYVGKITEQLKNLGFYSNSVVIPQQQELVERLGAVSGKDNYQLFMCNSGAEANENALKLASFHTGRKKVISFSKGFHGRTSLAVAITDGKKIVAPINETENAIILPFNDETALEEVFDAQGKEIAAVIIEGIQGLAGINLPTESFIKKIKSLCDKNGSVFIADAVQCGYGRSGKFFSHDYFGIEADIYSMAKGMGNGFPIGGILASDRFVPEYGMLGTTFGGNHLACAAANAVLEVMEEEKLMNNAQEVGQYIQDNIPIEGDVISVRGRGLMIGIELAYDASAVRKQLLFDHHIFTGTSSNKNVIRLLPALNLKKAEVDQFLEAFSKSMNTSVV